MQRSNYVESLAFIVDASDAARPAPDVNVKNYRTTFNNVQQSQTSYQSQSDLFFCVCINILAASIYFHLK